MNKEMKYDYDKALKAYHKGELNKSLKYCEDGISKNLKNSSLLNLKGLILYLKGDLEEAITVWKINKDFNDDNMAKTYIKDAKKDCVRKQEFEKARELIKDLHINDAIKILNICKESDFNSIQVNNLLALCEFKKGEYNKSREYIGKSLSIDKHNTNAIAIRKQLDKFTERKSNSLVALIILLIVCITGISVMKIVNYKNKENKLVEGNIINNNMQLTVIDDLSKESGDEVSEKEEIVKENNNEVKEDEDIEEELSITPEEIEKSYINASTYFSDGNYKEAIGSLEKVNKGLFKHYLNDDILFLIGSSYEKLEDVNNFIKYFEEYISLYENGDYIEEVYYKLALQYKDINKNKSREYANKLINNYPESIYNNVNIDSILTN